MCLFWNSIEIQRIMWLMFSSESDIRSPYPAFSWKLLSQVLLLSITVLPALKYRAHRAYPHFPGIHPPLLPRIYSQQQNPPHRPSNARGVVINWHPRPSQLNSIVCSTFKKIRPSGSFFHSSSDLQLFLFAWLRRFQCYVYMNGSSKIAAGDISYLIGRLWERAEREGDTSDIVSFGLKSVYVLLLLLLGLLLKAVKAQWFWK